MYTKSKSFIVSHSTNTGQYTFNALLDAPFPVKAIVLKNYAYASITASATLCKVRSLDLVSPASNKGELFQFFGNFGQSQVLDKVFLLEKNVGGSYQFEIVDFDDTTTTVDGIISFCLEFRG